MWLGSYFLRTKIRTKLLKILSRTKPTKHDNLYKFNGRLFSESQEHAIAFMHSWSEQSGGSYTLANGTNIPWLHQSMPLWASTYQVVSQRAFVPLSSRPVNVRHGDVRPLTATSGCARPRHPTLDDQTA